MKDKNKTNFTAPELYEMLAASVNPNRTAIFPEVRNGGGFTATRSADAVSFGLWPSDRYLLVGYEIKASRSDWLRELKQPKKADDMAKHCDKWIIVANCGVVDLTADELPYEWGLMEPRGTRLHAVRQSVRQLENLGKPVDRGFLASLLKRASQTSLAAKQADAIRAQCSALAAKESERNMSRLRERLAGAEKTIYDFERASGIKIGDWAGPEEIGKIVRDVLDDKYRDPEARLRTLQRTVLGIAADVEARLRAFESEKVA